MSLPLSIRTSQFGEIAQPDFSTIMEDMRDTQSILSSFANAFMDEVNLGILLLDMRGILVGISEFALDMFCLKKRKVIGMMIEHVFDDVPEERRTFFCEALRGKTFKNEMVSWYSETRNYELLVDSNRVYNRYGIPVGIYFVIKDITQLRLLEEQVRHSDRLKMIGQVAAGAAHEIRNPLTSIKGFLQLLKQTFHSHQLNRELHYTDVMLTEIERINQLVSEFLMLSKPRETTCQVTHVSEILRDILPVVESEANLHDLPVRCQLSGAFAEVLVDREQLKQVILNICKNAIEAMAQQIGTLTIRERINYHEQTVAIEIHDQGPGIPSFMIDKIFDPFFTTKESGTGLGLPICQRIVHDMCGHIRIASKGFGTTVTVVLPLHIKQEKTRKS